ncbi:hypothetical protein [Micromonospora sonneratiae]|uniref:Uncharacterized protein n=1 Tax=Micromonospora sonneratiae TaxID=1184706 RepID=A0ABW3Y7I0_9ACTN
MASVHVPDPVDVLRDFFERVSPYDPDPDAAPVGTVEVRSGFDSGAFPLTSHLARALGEALAGYRDPTDRGSCAGCGGRRLDENLHCQDCGRLHGVLGAVMADHAERIRRQSQQASSSPAGRGTTEVPAG